MLRIFKVMKALRDIILQVKYKIKRFTARAILLALAVKHPVATFTKYLVKKENTRYNEKNS